MKSLLLASVNHCKCLSNAQCLLHMKNKMDIKLKIEVSEKKCFTPANFCKELIFVESEQNF